MNRTTNYNLCQFEESDRVQRTDFNEDNVKIDAAIKAVDRRVDGLNTAKAEKAKAEAEKPKRATKAKAEKAPKAAAEKAPKTTAKAEKPKKAPRAPKQKP